MTSWKSWLAASAVLSAVFAMSGGAAAKISPESTTDVLTDSGNEVVSEMSIEADEPMEIAQVTSVAELSDVQADDWAFVALQRIVEEYGCLEGYPDRSFRGNRTLSRNEFAAGLNACLDVVVQLVALAQEPEINFVRRPQERIAVDLITLREDVDTLENMVAELEINQFSTTTKLRGQLDTHLVVPFGRADAIADATDSVAPDSSEASADGIVGGDEADATFEYRVRLSFDTSFTGEDRLRIRLQASDDAGALSNSESGLASQSGREPGEDSIRLDDVYYSRPLGDRVSATVAANSVSTDDFVTSTIVPFDGPSVADAGGPEFYDLYSGGDFGVGINYALSDSLVLDLGYSSDSSNVNTADGGLFQNYSYTAQLNLLTDGVLNGAIAYIDGENGSSGSPEYTIAGLLNLDFVGMQVGGHYAYTPAEGGGDLNSYMVGIALSDFLGAGNQLGIYGGISPDINRDPLLVEAYYNMTVNEFFTLTPAVIYTDNNGNADDSNNVYGAVRASFSF